jgi:hypothetical protein
MEVGFFPCRNEKRLFVADEISRQGAMVSRIGEQLQTGNATQHTLFVALK